MKWYKQLLGFWTLSSCITTNYLLWSFAMEAYFTGNGVFILDFNAYGELLPELILLTIANFGVVYFTIQWFKNKLEVKSNEDKRSLY